MLEPFANSLLIVEDDELLCQCLANAMEARGFRVSSAGTIAEALIQIESSAPTFATVDLRLPDGCGLAVIEALKRRRADARAIILTGYGNLATAVKAAKIGAIDYFTKLVDADSIASVLLAPKDCKPDPPNQPMTAERARWEHIQNIYASCGRNVSEAARRLAMHRRTLQRVLAKGTPR
jgi:two-component system, response regulator RegA